MLINKPDDAIVLLSYPQYAGRPFVCATVAYLCSVEGARLNEPQAWALLKARFANEPFDEGMKKARCTFAVAGDACAPRGRRVSGVEVRARCGDLEKIVHVRGDRSWRHGAMGWAATDPQPFEKQAIDLSRAYGGGGHPANPFGRGYAEGEPQAGMPLANIEAPSALCLSPHDKPEPVTLGLWPGTTPARMQWLGKFDAHWRRHTAPHLSDGTDARYFDAVSADQCKSGYWNGDESWSITGMNADAPRMLGRLPGLRPRLLYRFKDQSEGEGVLDLDTIWLLPNDGYVGLLYRAQFDAREIDGAALQDLFVHTERGDAPAANLATLRSLRHAATLATRPAKPEPEPTLSALSASPSMRTSELPTAASSQAPQRATVRDHIDATRRGMHAEMVATAAALKQSHGICIDIPPLEALGADAPSVPRHALPPGGVRQYIAESRQRLISEMHTAASTQGVDIAAFAAQAGQVPKSGATLSESLAHMRQKLQQSAVTEATKQEIFQHLDKFENMEQTLRAKSDDPSTLRAMPDPRDANARRPRRTGLSTRDDFVSRLENQTSLRQMTFRGLDLSGLDLHGRDFTGSVFLNCSLEQANLDDALFDDGNLDACRLDGASLTRTLARRSIWQQCTLKSATLDSADFNHARLTDCDLTLVHAHGAVLDHAELSNTTLVHASMENLQAARSQWRACTVSDTRFDHAALNRSSFESCTLDRCIFNNAHLCGVNGSSMLARTCSFSPANAQNLRLDTQCHLVDCDFAKAQLRQSCFEQSHFERCKFERACLDKALLENCVVSGGEARYISAKEAVFNGSHISDISLSGSNLMQATFRRTTLQRVDLAQTNLFATDFTGANKEQLCIKGALTSRSNLVEPVA